MIKACAYRGKAHRLARLEGRGWGGCGGAFRNEATGRIVAFVFFKLKVGEANVIDKCSCGYAYMLSHFSRVQLFATLWISQPGSSVHGILQARILEWVAILSSRGLPNPGIDPRSPTLQADSLPSEPPGKPKNTGVGSPSV